MYVHVLLPAKLPFPHSLIMNIVVPLSMVWLAVFAADLADGEIGKF